MINMFGFQLDTYLNEAAALEKATAIFRSEKIPKNLVGNEDLALLKEDIEAEATIDADDDLDHDAENGEVEAIERENARIFVDKLKGKLGHIMEARSSVEIDYRIQEFASGFCHGIEEIRNNHATLD